MATVEQAPQPMRALQLANRARRNIAALKAEVRSGAISLADALVDERAGSLTVADLLAAQHGWGTVRVSGVLQGLLISEVRRVRALTPRQCEVIVEACEAGSAGEVLDGERVLILQCLAAADEPLAASDVAERLDLPRRVGARFTALERMGLLERLDRPRRCGWSITAQGREVVSG